MGAEASSLSLPAEDMIDCLGNPGQWAEEFLGLRRERSEVAGPKKKSVPLSSFLYTAGTKEKRELVHPTTERPKKRKIRRPEVAKTVLKKKSKVGGLECPDFQTYHKATDRCVVERPEINSDVCN